MDSLLEMIEQIYFEYAQGNCSAQLLVLADELHTLIEEGEPLNNDEIIQICITWHGDAHTLLRKYGVDILGEQGSNT